MTNALRPSERRAFGRRESSIHAMARMSGRAFEPCIVRDFSDGGARLEFRTAVAPPAKFRLVIEAKGFDAECEVRHHDGKSVGVRFIREDAGKSLDEAPPQRVTAPGKPQGTPPGKLAEGWRAVSVVSGEDVRRGLLGVG